MNSSDLVEIEQRISELSQKEQLLLIERLAHNLRESTLKDQGFVENQLAAMASDPEIQNELRKINEEFAVADLDGMEKL
jgi:hypothetical protein